VNDGGSDLAARVLVALILIPIAIVLVWQGGEVFALGLVVLGVIALGELYTLMERVRPPALVTMFGVLWIGLAMVHAIWLRKLSIEQDGKTVATGMGLVFDVLIATFVGDTFAYFVGRAYGRSQFAPLISPNKTIEGLLGGVFGGTLAFWCAGLYQDWLTGWDALLIGFLVAITAPLGDLFESLVKRDLAVKDTGTLFGAHGGVLDRLDAVLFTVVVGYYAAVGLGYG
jgi:phosphatidate cytidylyltransferase